MSEHLKGVGGAQRHLFFYRPRTRDASTEINPLSPIPPQDNGGNDLDDVTYRSQATQTVIRDSEVQTDPVLMRMAGWKMLTYRGSHRRFQSLPLSSNPYALNYSEYENEGEEWIYRRGSEALAINDNLRDEKAISRGFRTQGLVLHVPEDYRIQVRHVASETSPKSSRSWPMDPGERWTETAIKLQHEEAQREAKLRGTLARLHCQLNLRDEAQLSKIHKETQRALNRLNERKVQKKESSKLRVIQYPFPATEILHTEVQVSASTPRIQLRKPRRKERALADALQNLLV